MNLDLLEACPEDYLLHPMVIAVGKRGVSMSEALFEVETPYSPSSSRNRMGVNPKRARTRMNSWQTERRT